MKTQLSINQHNVRPHIDIERDIQLKGNGLFTFNLRISQGNIEDYATFETVTGSNFKGVEFVIEEEHTTSYHP